MGGYGCASSVPMPMIVMPSSSDSGGNKLGPGPPMAASFSGPTYAGTFSSGDVMGCGGGSGCCRAAASPSLPAMDPGRPGPICTGIGCLLGPQRQ